MTSVTMASTAQVGFDGPTARNSRPPRSKVDLSAAVGFLSSLFAASAFAQAPTPAGVDAAAQQGELQEIVVSGVRYSVQAAQDIKRDADSVVEAITFEDLGKFTDASVADAVQRLPGVNIERNARGIDGGTGITIRGLGPEYVTSTLNGRELLGNPTFFGLSGGRTLDYDSIPPEIISGVTVYKSPTADLIESGLGGEVDIHTLRPLDYHPKNAQQFFGDVSVGANEAFHYDHIEPRLSLILGAKLFDNTLGVYVSGLSSKSENKIAALYAYPDQNSLNLANASGNVTTIGPVQDVDGESFIENYDLFTQKGVSADIQWRPSSSFEVNSDFLTNEFITNKYADGNDFYNFFNINLNDTSAQRAIFSPGAAILRGDELGYTNSNLISYPIRPDANIGYTHVVNDNKMWVAGVTPVWKIDAADKLSADYAHNSATYTMDWRAANASNAGCGGTEDIYNGLNGNSGFPSLTFSQIPGCDMTNPAAYSGDNFFLFQSLNKQVRDSVRIDFERALSHSIKLKVGASYQATTSKFILMDQPTSGPYAPAFNPAGFFTGAQITNPGYSTTEPQVSQGGVCASNPLYCTASNFGIGSMAGDFPVSPNGNPGDKFVFDTSQSYQVKERKSAFYAQLSFADQIFDMKAAGNAGLRAVRVTENGQAFQGVSYKIGYDTGSFDPNSPSVVESVRGTNSYWEYLPTANLTLMPLDNLNLRLGVARTMSLPDYFQLAPRGTVLYIEPNASGQHTPDEFNGGNIRLKPTTAWNYDLTGEYYTSYGGAYVASLFYKVVSDLVQTETLLGQTIQGQGSTAFTSSAPINVAHGRTYGAELGTNQPFTFLPSPWDGFGLQANYYYVGGSLSAGQNTATQFAGTSKNNANVAIYFEKYGWTVRAAFNYRSEYLFSLGSPASSLYHPAATDLDASISKEIGPYVTVLLSGTNLGHTPQRSVFPEGTFQGYYERPSIYTLSVRAKF